MNDQHLVLEIYFVFHANCTAPGFDPHTGRMEPATSGFVHVCSWNRCYSGVYVFGCDSSHEYRRGIWYRYCPFSYRICSTQEEGLQWSSDEQVPRMNGFWFGVSVRRP